MSRSVNAAIWQKYDTMSSIIWNSAEVLQVTKLIFWLCWIWIRSNISLSFYFINSLTPIRHCRILGDERIWLAALLIRNISQNRQCCKMLNYGFMFRIFKLFWNTTWLETLQFTVMDDKKINNTYNKKLKW